jgi:hypothetical protein
MSGRSVRPAWNPSNGDSGEAIFFKRIGAVMFAITALAPLERDLCVGKTPACRSIDIE